MHTGILSAVGGPIEPTKASAVADRKFGPTGSTVHFELYARSLFGNEQRAAVGYTELGEMPRLDSMPPDQVEEHIRQRHRMLVAAQFIGVPISAEQIEQLELLARQYQVEHLLRR